MEDKKYIPPQSMVVIVKLTYTILQASQGGREEGGGEEGQFEPGGDLS